MASKTTADTSVERKESLAE
jgi:hypothetical protein